MAAPATALKPAAAPRQNRMTLASVLKGKKDAPYRLLVMGVDGVGKSSFAASAPSAIFLGPELGTNHLDVARFPVPESFEDVLDAIRTLTADRGEFESLAIDSIDWIEPLIWRWVCEQAGVKTIEEVGGGYGKGYVAALDAWRMLLAALERLQRERGMHVVLIAHAFIKPFRNPEGEDFERYVLKLHDKAAALCREWSEGVYFAQFETFAVKEKGKRVKGVSTGARLLYTQRTAAYDAKDRYGLPESLPLDWNEFVAAAAAGRPVESKHLVEAIQAAAAELGDELKKTTLEYLAAAGDDAVKLSKLSNWVNAKLGAKRQQEGG
jgi:hypothetical protein